MSAQGMADNEVGSGEPPNTLANSSSAYLRSAMHQPVGWMPWGQAAFDRAIAEDKPILLDIGAVWCHWCHVMDRESYEDAATARLINQYFIAVKVDRDERPDVDTRYQSAVSAISGQGGWPLTAFLTPEGKPYFGGTYFPPEDRYGRPSFQRVLLTMAEAFRERRAEVDESAGSVMSAIEHNEAFSGHASDPGPELVEKMVVSMLKIADLRHGGFGSQPKFAHSSAIDLLIDFASRKSDAIIKMGQSSLTLPEACQLVAKLTLNKMAKGGIHDQLAGGFHRYSVDEHWIVPHFEKMAYDNSELLKNYLHAYQSFGEDEFADVARDTMRWMDEWLSDREQGGFYASQDADFSLDDDGDFFTWTRDEAAEVLSAEELEVAAYYYDIGEIGDMQHNVAKNVLHLKHSIDEMASRAHLAIPQTQALLNSATQKLYAARLKRPMPYIDKTVYVAWNAMCISAYLEAARVLNLPEAKDFALKSLDRVLIQAWDEKRGLAHVVAYGEQVEKPTTFDRVPGGLDDYIFLGHAALDAWQQTGELRFYQAAEQLMDSALQRFSAPLTGGFFDTEKPVEGTPQLGALVARRKPLQDSPTPAANPVAAALLLRLYQLNARAEYGDKALQTLENFAAIVEHFGLYSATYALALQKMVTPPEQVCVIGDDAQADALQKAALRRFSINRSVVRLTREQLATLPPLLAETLPYLPKVQGSFAVLCSGNTCQQPINSPAELAAALNETL